MRQETAAARRAVGGGKPGRAARRLPAFFCAAEGRTLDAPGRSTGAAALAILGALLGFTAGTAFVYGLLRWVALAEPFVVSAVAALGLLVLNAVERRHAAQAALRYAEAFHRRDKPAALNVMAVEIDRLRGVALIQGGQRMRLVRALAQAILLAGAILGVAFGAERNFWLAAAISASFWLILELTLRAIVAVGLRGGCAISRHVRDVLAFEEARRDQGLETGVGRNAS